MDYAIINRTGINTNLWALSWRRSFCFTASSSLLTNASFLAWDSASVTLAASLCCLSVTKRASPSLIVPSNLCEYKKGNFALSEPCLENAELILPMEVRNRNNFQNNWNLQEWSHNGNKSSQLFKLTKHTWFQNHNIYYEVSLANKILDLQQSVWFSSYSWLNKLRIVQITSNHNFTWSWVSVVVLV